MFQRTSIPLIGVSFSSETMWPLMLNIMAKVNEDKPIAPKNNGLLNGEIEGASQHLTICLKFCLEALCCNDFYF